MSATIEIRISDEPTSETVHRFQNFGEDVYRALCATCPMSIDPIDCATTSFMTETGDRYEQRRHDVERPLLPPMTGDGL